MSLICISLMFCDVEHLVIYLLIFVCLVWKKIYSVPLPVLKLKIFFLLSSCMRSLYILYVNPLPDIRFINIFSHSLGFFFHLLIMYFVLQILFSFFPHGNAFYCNYSTVYMSIPNSESVSSLDSSPASNHMFIL